MARSIDTIYNEIRNRAITLATDAGDNDMLDMLNNSSRVAVWKMLFYACAFAIYTMETLYDLFRLETDDRISRLKPHSARWYAEKAKAFQYGQALVSEQDYYDNTGLTQAQIDEKKIVAYAAVVDQDRGIRIKVARLVAGVRAALDNDQLTAFTEYMEEIKDAGVKLLITTGDPDELKAVLRIFYNPLVLKADGSRIDGNGATPVQDALNDYLDNLPFNGIFCPSLAVDALQKVDGVVLVKDDSWMARYAALAFSNIDVEYNPDSGYLTIDEDDLEIEFTPHAVI
jgi:hypothetical protein